MESVQLQVTIAPNSQVGSAKISNIETTFGELYPIEGAHRRTRQCVLYVCVFIFFCFIVFLLFVLRFCLFQGVLTGIVKY